MVGADPTSAGDAIPLPRVTNSIFGVPGVHLSQIACPILFQASLWSDVSPIFVAPPQPCIPKLWPWGGVCR